MDSLGGSGLSFFFAIVALVILRGCDFFEKSRNLACKCFAFSTAFRRNRKKSQPL
jgi:hypothetical protein